MRKHGWRRGMGTSKMILPMVTTLAVVIAFNLPFLEAYKAKTEIIWGLKTWLVVILDVVILLWAICGVIGMIEEKREIKRKDKNP